MSAGNELKPHADWSDRADETMDLRGLLCPEPLMLLRNKVRGRKQGDLLYIVATDPSTERDFESFCRFMEHTFEDRHEDQHRGDETVFHFLIRKGRA